MTARQTDDQPQRSASEQIADVEELEKLRNHLATHNGIKGLDVLETRDVGHAISLFRRDGFVAMAGVLNDEQTEILARACEEVAAQIIALDERGKGNRGAHRYSFGGSSLTRSQLHNPAWQMLLDIPVVLEVLGGIFGSQDFILRAASGDFCMPGAHGYQPLHSDIRDWESEQTTKFSAFHDPTGHVNIRDLPTPYVAVNFLPQDVTRLNGPTRQIPGTQKSRGVIPSLRDEPEWMRLSTVCPVPAGSIMIRDTRAWHGGTPNLTDSIRSIPNLEIYAPWFREPMVPGITYADFKNLSERAQRLVRYSVADSSETLATGVTLKAP